MLRTRLLERGERYVLEAILLNSKPVLFSSRLDYQHWRNEIASANGLRSSVNLILMGSVVTGFSLSPIKYGRPFAATAADGRASSDLDLSIVDGQLFHKCWDAILSDDRRRRLLLTNEEKTKLKQDVYYGFIPDKTIPRASRIFQRVVGFRIAAGRNPVSRGIRLNLRIYRRSDDFAGYQLASLGALKQSFTTNR